MSTTPRTDAATGRSINNHYGPSQSDELYTDPTGPFVHASFARQLEMELAEAEAALELEVGQLRAQLAVLKADTDRLDWLATEHYLVDFINEDVEPTLRGEWICTNGDNSHKSVSLRAAIDAAMKEGSK